MDQPSPHPRPPRHSAVPSDDFLADLYRHLPLLVVHLTPDGTILHCNPEVSRATGYAESDLLGKTSRALLFPGRLFSQIPKFISAVHPLQAFAQDVPMTLRTRDGKERIIAWSRFIHEGPIHSSKGGSHSLICIGKDLTDRLLDSDNIGQPEPAHAPPSMGNAGAIEGDIVTPLAISPPLPPSSDSGPAAIQQIHEFLSEIDARVLAMEAAFSKGELHHLAGIAERLHTGALACGLLDFSTRAESLRQAATTGALQDVTTLVHQILTLCRADGKPPL